MKYSRRSRRPDSLFYRDQRRLSLSRRSRMTQRVYIIVALVLAIGIAAYMLFRP